MIISVSETIGSASATIRDHGLAVYKIAKEEIKQNHQVTISFDGIDMVISSFLNASIGKLYGDFSFSKVDELLNIVGLDIEDMELLEVTVIPNAKEFYTDSDKIDKIEESVIGSEK